MLLLLCCRRHSRIRSRKHQGQRMHRWNMIKNNGYKNKSEISLSPSGDGKKIREKTGTRRRRRRRRQTIMQYFTTTIMRMVVEMSWFSLVLLPLFLKLTLAIILTGPICPAFAHFFISIVNFFSSRSSPVFSLSNSRIALVIIRLFSRSTSLRGLSFPSIFPMIAATTKMKTTGTLFFSYYQVVASIDSY